MSRKLTRLAVGMIAAAAAGLLPISAASAEEVDTVAGSLELSISDSNTESSTLVTLTCSPYGGDHPHIVEACRQLTDNSGSFAEINAKDQMCTMQYAPVTVHAKGAWGGETVNYHASFENQCVANRDTGGVIFDF